LPNLLAFNEIRVSFKQKFILDCYKKQFLDKHELAILREELTKIEVIENQLSHVKSIVYKTLSLNSFQPKSNLTI